MRHFKSKLEEKFYKTWADMKHRCKSPKYKNYFGAGIRVCKSWRLFDNFEKDMWKSFCKHIKIYGTHQTTLDRINPYGDYKKSNCKWSTYKEQRINVRSRKLFVGERLSDHEKILFDNKTDFCKQYNLSRTGIYRCLYHNQKSHKGWSFHIATKSESKKFLLNEVI